MFILFLIGIISFFAYSFKKREGHRDFTYTVMRKTDKKNDIASFFYVE